MSSKYEVSQKEVSTLLEFIKSGEIAIPEIQRPFVWEKSKVRDLMDSLYQGYPVGYIIVWRNPNVKLKRIFPPKIPTNNDMFEVSVNLCVIM